MGSFASFLLNHFADSLDAIEPTVPLGFGLERRRGNEIAISRMKHFSSQEPIPGFLWTIADAVVRDVDDLVVVCLNGESYIKSKTPLPMFLKVSLDGGMIFPLICGPSTDPSGWLTTLNVSSMSCASAMGT